MNDLILASASPRRKALMQLLGLPFRVVAANADESSCPDLSPEETVVFLARLKAKAVKKENPGSTVIGSDTIVYADGKILGKPENEQDAFLMLRDLSGKTHQVYTGVSILFADGREDSFYECAQVTFFPLSDEEIRAYIATGEPMDKAGAYGIQEKGALLVRKIDGDFYTVMGLPIGQLTRRLSPKGVSFVE